MKTPDEMLAALGEGRGAIVSSADCSSAEIAYAQACGRWCVTPDGSGYVLRTKGWREAATRATELAALCRSLLPYAERDKSPGPAMSDPWGPPTELIAKTKVALAAETTAQTRRT